jgi:NADH:ubiquinone oxidoreductase subunit
MDIGTLINSFLFGKFVGHDKYGNSYYCNNKSNKTKEKRWVLYKGTKEASKIPSKWQLWLHHTSDHIPSEEQSESHFWQKPYRPNYTGTSKAYKSCSTKKDNLKFWNDENTQK